MSILHNLKKKTRRGWPNIAWDYFKTIGISLVLALIVKTSVVEAYIIPTGSMENTLLAGDYILGNKFIYGMKLPIPFVDLKLPAIQDPEPGDIIIFKNPMNPGQYYIKRCIAVEGQTVEIRNKRIYVDDILVPLPPEGKHLDGRIIALQRPARWGLTIRDNMPPIKVPAGKLFMMGDNRDNSLDSRFWGFLDRRLVLARALMVLWSWEYSKQVQDASGSFSNFDLWWYNIRNFPELVQNLRWNRFGKIVY